MKMFRRGSVLVLTLIATAMVTILVGAMGAYYVNSARLADGYMTGRSEPRAVAQGALEQVNQVITELSAEFASSSSSPETIQAAVVAAKEKVEKIESSSTMKTGGNGIELTAEKLGNDKLKVTATVMKNGRALASVEEILEFYYGGSDSWQLPYIFDYVYFVDNYGHLETTSLIVNGDVHSNDKFTVNGPVINGYASAASNVVDVVDGKIWSEKKYVAQVKAKFGASRVRTRVRPTNPIAGVSWQYGYEPPIPIVPYSFTNQPPDGVEKPDHELVVPDFPDPGETRPADPRPIDVPPTEITTETGSTQVNVTKWKYVYYRFTYFTHTYWTHVYYTNSKKSDKYYSSAWDARKDAVLGTVEEHTDYYGSQADAENGKKNKKNKGTVTKYEKKYDTQADADAAKSAANGKGSITQTSTICGTQNEADRAKRNNSNKGTVTEIVEYYDTEAAANAAKNNNNNKGKVKRETVTETVTKYTYVYKGIRYETLADAEAARAQAQSVYEANLQKLKEYEEYPAKRQAWLDYYALKSLWDKYDKYLKDLADFNGNYAVYTNSVKNWETQLDTEGVDLNLVSAGTKNDNGRLVTVVNNNVDYMPMLSVSDTEKYLNLCKNGKGSLYCENSYYDENSKKQRIVWKNKGQMDTVAMMIQKPSDVIWEGLSRRFVWGDWNLDSSSSSVVTDYIISQRENASNPWRQKSWIRMTRALSKVDIKNGGYKADGSRMVIYPFDGSVNAWSGGYDFTFLSHLGLNPTYDTLHAAVNYPSVPGAVTEIEKNSVILIGTESFPITIDGPVYIEGDVVIRGFVSGRGAIYSGRNIHIIGDLAYKNPPEWPYDASGMTAGSKTKDTVDYANATKDLLLLCARGNIVIGDYTSNDWNDSDNSQYLKSLHGAASQYGDSYSDDEIGYKDFSRDYTKFDGKKKVTIVEPDVNLSNPRLSGDNPIVKVQWYYTGELTKSTSWKDYNWYFVPKLTAPASANCKFYECVLGDAVIKGLKQASNEEAEDSSEVTPFTNTEEEKNQDSGDITQIDAVLFANHGIFGVVGGTKSHKFVLNGAMACRDEALFPSFDARFANTGDPAPQIWLNWDMRIKSNDLQEWVSDVDLIKSPTSGGAVTNRVTSWRQLK